MCEAVLISFCEWLRLRISRFHIRCLSGCLVCDVLCLLARRQVLINSVSNLSFTDSADVQIIVCWKPISNIVHHSLSNRTTQTTSTTQSLFSPHNVVRTIRVLSCKVAARGETEEAMAGAC